MKRNDGWINALFSLVFIAAPALVLFFFFLPGWTGDDTTYSYGLIWAIALSFLAYVALLSWLLIYFEWLAIDSLNFNIPVSLALMSILVSYPLPLWATAIIVVAVILFAFPVNVMVSKYKEHKIANLQRKK